MRLVNVERVANWVTGDLQLFFAGAWGQVCPSLFGGRDADVACRQLGFSAGSQGYPTTDFDMDSFPEAVLAGSGCIGTERNLLECEASAEMDMYDSSVCRRSLRLACVDPEADGKTLSLLQCELVSCMPAHQGHPLVASGIKGSQRDHTHRLIPLAIRMARILPFMVASSA